MIMVGCDTQPCKGDLSKLGKQKQLVDDAWKYLQLALAAAGFTGSGTLAIILAWVVRKAAEIAFPGIGWVLGICTIIAILAAIAAFAVWRSRKNDLEEIAEDVKKNCDHKCWPDYIK